ncbi:unnamed protein product [Larinioides sclopetarius]|uniref:Uncharacterized protein n=1 Tax=Larinioides sclopetarius TaxID=280406 RepID=A0AAV1ZGP1_9ARAC
MAEISFDFRNIFGSKKCAISSSRIVSLEIGDESPGVTSESVFQEIFNDQVCHNDAKNKSNLICGFDKQSDKNSLIHSQSFLSTFTCEGRPLDKIKPTNDSDIDLDLLNSTDLGRTVESGAGNFNSKKATSDDNMKIISEVEVCDGLSDLLSSITHVITEKDESGSTFEYYQRKITRDCDMGLPDFEILKNGCADSLLANNSSLTVEGNQSDLLSSINIEDSVVTKIGSFNSKNFCNSTVAEKSEMKGEPPVSDLSDLLSSIDLGDSNENKTDNYNHVNMGVLETKNESCLADLLSSINIEDSVVTKVGSFNSKDFCNSTVVEKSEMKSEPPVSDLSDLLSSIDLGDSNVNKTENYNHVNMGVSETKNESCLADLLSSINIEDSVVTKVGSFNSKNFRNSTVAKKSEMESEPPVSDLSDLLSFSDLGDSNEGKIGNCKHVNLSALETKNESCSANLLSSIGKSNKPAMTVLNSKPLNFGSSNSYFKDTNGISDSFNDFIFDIGSSSSSNSCASSYSEEENSPKDSSTKNTLLADKIFESDSGYSSFDSADKGFSFFDYSSDKQFSLNTLLTGKSDASISEKHSNNEISRDTNEEMSMSDLLTIVSPEFKNPVLTSLNKAEKCKVNKDNLNMQDLVECMSVNNLVEGNEKLMNFDCVDGRISDIVQSEMETVDSLGDALLGKDISITKRDFVKDDEQIDLRECIKTAKHQFIPTSPVKQNTSVENQRSECVSSNKILFYHEDKSSSDSSKNRSNSFEFNDVGPRKKTRVNTKQTLFSKALACKPKKDHALLQKVDNIKNELLNNILNRPVFIDCDVPQPVVESVVQSDKCILSKEGRRCFGLVASWELQ